MDAHTARCLQLSTSIQAPFSQQNAANAGPYRHNRFESMNRSRYQPQQQNGPPRSQQPRANSMPAVSRYPQPQQQPAAFKRNFQNPMMGGGMAYGQQMMPHHTSSPSSGDSSSYDGTSLFSASNTVSPETPFGAEGQWDPTFGIDMKQMQKSQDGMGMGFLEQDVDFGNPFGLQSTDGVDLIHLNEQDHQVHPHKPMSPDRNSLSSNSSNDNGAEQLDLSAAPSDGMQVLSQDIPMATVEEDEPIGNFRGSARHSHSRSNSRAPAPRASSTRRFRRQPYSFDGHRRSSSVMSSTSSVGSVPPMSMPPTQCCSPVNECQDDFGLTDFSQLDFGSSRPSVSDDLFAMDPMHMPQFQPDMIAPQPKYMADQMFLHHGFEDPLFDATAAPILPSSHVPNDPTLHGQVDEFAEYAEEPDLFGALSEEPSVPSEEDMNPEDESMKPQEQESRFEGDLYTPRFVRGTGVNREGYCGLCKPGRWLVLKNSAYWYDKSFTHGISAATGQPFDGPKETRRMSGNPDVWEGLCGCCNEWIALISNKKKGTTWFRHAYKCHNSNKNKDGKKKNKKNKDKESSAEPAAKDESHNSPGQQQQQAQQQQPSQQAPPQHHMMQQQHPQTMAPQQNMHALQTIGSFF